MAEVINGILVNEAETKNIMTKSSLPVGGYSVNPYVGCTHACKYCYASFMKRFTGHKEEWGTFLDVKHWPKIKNPKKYAIINLGHETTNVSVFSRGKLMNTETIQLGGINVDKDLAYMFNINVFDAREIKEKFASSHKRFIALNDVYEVKNTAGEVIKLNQIEVTEIVMDRLAELLRLAQKQILLLTKQNISYIVITGGLTEIRAFKNLVYEILGKDVIIYTEDTLGARNNKYTTSIGMIKYFIDKMEVRGKEYSMIDEQDEELLINPNNKNSKGKASITKIFGNFIGTKED